MIFLVDACKVAMPLLLKYTVDAIICDIDTEDCPSSEETYTLITFYVIAKFSSDIINNLREIPYTMMAAQAEISIAHDVHDHVQRQSIAFHLSRETGKIIRMVSKGSQSFAQTLRHLMFQMLPIFLGIILTLLVFITLFSWQFFVLLMLSIIVYGLVTWQMTEYRAKGFKSRNKADKEYNQKATDSLLNFETVKYFNAEKHEENRFEKALDAYKQQNI